LTKFLSTVALVKSTDKTNWWKWFMH